MYLIGAAHANKEPARRALEEAVAAGEVSLAQAAEVMSVPGHETELLEVARSSGLRAVRDLGRKRRCEGIDREELHAQQRAAREFQHWRDDSGWSASAVRCRRRRVFRS